MSNNTNTDNASKNNHLNSNLANPEVLVELKDNENGTLVFTGSIVAAVDFGSHYEDLEGKAVALTLYKTNDSKFVCHRVTDDNWSQDSESTVSEAVIVDSEDQVVSFFGQHWTAKALYQRAGLDYAESIDDGSKGVVIKGFKEIFIERGNQAAIKFKGKILGYIRFQHEYFHDYEEELRLIVMPNGRFVCESTEHFYEHDEMLASEVAFCESYNEVASFFEPHLQSDAAHAWVGTLEELISNNQKSVEK